MYRRNTQCDTERYSMYSMYRSYDHRTACAVRTVCSVQYVQIVRYVQYVQYVHHIQYVSMYVCTYVPDIPITPNVSTNIGHRFGHQSGVYESSGRNAAANLNVFATRVYLVFAKICTVVR